MRKVYKANERCEVFSFFLLCSYHHIPIRYQLDLIPRTHYINIPIDTKLERFPPLRYDPTHLHTHPPLLSSYQPLTFTDWDSVIYRNPRLSTHQQIVRSAYLLYQLTRPTPSDYSNPRGHRHLRPTLKKTRSLSF